jgi:hypothetical protein
LFVERKCVIWKKVIQSLPARPPKQSPNDPANVCVGVPTSATKGKDKTQYVTRGNSISSFLAVGRSEANKRTDLGSIGSQLSLTQ